MLEFMATQVLFIETVYYKYFRALNHGDTYGNEGKQDTVQEALGQTMSHLHFKFSLPFATTVIFSRSLQLSKAASPHL